MAKPDADNNEAGKPWDAAVNAISQQLESVNKSVRDFTEDRVNQVKDIANGNVEQVKELTSSARIAVRRAGKQVFEGIQKAVQPVVQVFDQADSKDGTGLRKQISSVREEMNYHYYDAQVKWKDTKQATDEQLAPVKEVLGATQQQLVKLNEFRREHPEAAVAGLVAVVGAPSLLLRGKFVAVRNVLVAVGGGAAVAYGSDRLAAKKK